MENDIYVKNQDEMTFLELIKSKTILIPKIQRDYAQGRMDKKAIEIRDRFLDSIIEVLNAQTEEPLVLDFIYGSTINDVDFIPLDGQQRLTTLFLLHWYLIPKDELTLLSFSKNMNLFSRFSYETRISSKDFCNELVKNSFFSIDLEYKNRLKEFDILILECEKYPSKLRKLELEKKSLFLSNIIKNQPWFRWNWRKDPTIIAMLVMLDDMHERFGTQVRESLYYFWERLKTGKIVFNLLPLEKFGLTNELYVKMNARGKELSSFDIIKSTLEEQMRQNGVEEHLQEFWINNVDSNWIDLFWNKLAKGHLSKIIDSDIQLVFVDSVEEGYLRFLKRMMVFHLFTNDDCLLCDWTDVNIKRYIPFEYKISDIKSEKDNRTIINGLREYTVNRFKYGDGDVLDLMPLFCKSGFFNNKFFKFVINTFESIIFYINEEKHEGSELLDNIGFDITQKTIFEAFISDKVIYDTRVQFFALLCFFKYNNAEKVCNDSALTLELNSWMRIIRNLSTNSNTYFFDDYEKFLKSLKVIENWSEEVFLKRNFNSIIDFFVNSNNLDGFNGEQLLEEKIKANLIENNLWMSAIIVAEENPYFLGQIRFLFDWSRSDNTYDVVKFNEYYGKISSIFNANGLVEYLSKDYLFRNALMTCTDWYLLRNCFLSNKGKERDTSWKRYLRESGHSINIKRLLDRWDSKRFSFQEFCIDLVTNNAITDWRRCFLEYPEIYNELKDNKIVCWNDSDLEICLLSKTRWSSKHKELRTFYWFVKYKKHSNDAYLDSTNESHPFSTILRIDNNLDVSVKYIYQINMSKYVLSTNFTCTNFDFTKNLTNNRWEMFFDSSEYAKVEQTLSLILNQYRN